MLATVASFSHPGTCRTGFFAALNEPLSRLIEAAVKD